jgi:hypothetical protein
MSKLENYLSEARNLKGDIGKIKKITKDYAKKESMLQDKMYSDMDKVVQSILNNNIPDEELEKFFADLTKEMQKMFLHRKDIMMGIDQRVFALSSYDG